MNMLAKSRASALMSISSLSMFFVIAHENLPANPSSAVQAKKPVQNRVPKRWRDKKLIKRLNDEVTRSIQQSGFDYYPDAVSVKGMSGSPLFREILKRASPNELEWLSENLPYPAKLAPFAVAVEKRKQLAPSIAVRVIASSEKLPTLVASPVILYLNELPANKTTIEALKLDSIALRFNKHKETLALLAAALPDRIKKKWYADHKRPACKNALYVFVLSELISKVPKGKQPSKQMQSSLKQCAKQSLQGKIAYVYHAKEQEPDYRSTLRDCLQDKELSKLELTGILVVKKDYIRKHLKLDTLAVSPERRKQIKRIWAGIMRSTSKSD